MEKTKPLVHTATTAWLIGELQASDPDGTALVSLAGCLRVLKVKRRGPALVDIEAAEVVMRDPNTGAVTVVLPD